MSRSNQMRVQTDPETQRLRKNKKAEGKNKSSAAKLKSLSPGPWKEERMKKKGL